jgi:uncharacterized protein (DUF433 family)
MSVAATIVAKPHISADAAICGGKPCIAGTRIRVQDIYVWHELQSKSADEIVAEFPHLTHADVYAALSYFWDHRETILADMDRGDKAVEEMKQQYQSKLRPKS